MMISRHDDNDAGISHHHGDHRRADMRIIRMSMTMTAIIMMMSMMTGYGDDDWLW